MSTFESVGLYCKWSVSSYDPSYNETLWNVGCRASNFVTKFSPDDNKYCPFCGGIVEKKDANT